MGNSLQQQIFGSSSFKGWKESKLCYKVLSSAASFGSKKISLKLLRIEAVDCKISNCCPILSRFFLMTPCLPRFSNK